MAESRHRLHLLIADTFGVMVAGSRAPEVKALAAALGADSGPCRLVGQGSFGGLPIAALVNSVAAAWMDFDAPHAHPHGPPLRPSAHYACHVVPAALAAAELGRASGREFADAVRAGYERSARIGDGWHQRPGIHPHGTIPNVGAALAVAELGSAHADPDAVARRAGMLTLMPPYSAAQEGGTVRNAFAGVGSCLGAVAAALPAQLTAGRDPIGEVLGTISGTGLESGASSGATAEVDRACFKMYPCARYLHAGIEAARATNRLGVAPARMRSVVVETYRLAVDLDNGIACPRTPLEARFSLAFTVAVALVRGDVVPDDFAEPRLSDSAVQQVAQRIVVRASDALTARAPSSLCARVTVDHGSRHDVVGGGETLGPEAPLDTLTGRVGAKFTRLVGPVLGEAAAARVLAELMSIEDIRDMREWTSCLS